jgi:hypothetical protein
LANKKTRYWVRQKSKGITEGTSGLAHRTVRCATGQCPVHQGWAALELASFGNSQRLVRYNSPDMSGVHRTVRCDIEATDTSTPMATCSALNARQRAQKSGTPMLAHRTLYSACPVRHRTSRGPRRQSSNGRNPTASVTWLHRTCPVHHSTVSPTKRLVWWLGL